MAYQKQNFQNDRVLNADELNHIEDGIEELERQIENITPGGDTPTPVTSDNLFLVTIDHNAKTASHSESEIKAAKESGKVVVTMDRYGMLMPLYDADSGCFEGIYRSGSDKLLYERYTVAEDKSVTIEQGEVNDNFIITVNGDQKTCDKTFTEVQQALENGKDIIVRFVRSIGTLLVYPVIVVSDGGIVISIVYHSSTTKNTAASVVMVLLPDNRFDLAVGEASFPPAANNVADGKVLTVSGGNAVWADPPLSPGGSDTSSDVLVVQFKANEEASHSYSEIAAAFDSGKAVVGTIPGLDSTFTLSAVDDNDKLATFTKFEWSDYYKRIVILQYTVNDQKQTSALISNRGFINFQPITLDHTTNKASLSPQGILDLTEEGKVVFGVYQNKIIPLYQLSSSTAVFQDLHISLSDGGIENLRITVNNSKNMTVVVDKVTTTGEKGDKGDKGDQGEPGEDGEDGYTPVRGTDYWTPADQAAIVSDVLAALPAWTGGSY